MRGVYDAIQNFPFPIARKVPRTQYTGLASARRTRSGSSFIAFPPRALIRLPQGRTQVPFLFRRPLAVALGDQALVFLAGEAHADRGIAPYRRNRLIQFPSLRYRKLLRFDLDRLARPGFEPQVADTIGQVGDLLQGRPPLLGERVETLLLKRTSLRPQLPPRDRQDRLQEGSVPR